MRRGSRACGARHILRPVIVRAKSLPGSQASGLSLGTKATHPRRGEEWPRGDFKFTWTAGAFLRLTSFT